MILDYALGAVVTVGIFFYLVYALLRPRALLRDTAMTVNGWIQIALFCAVIIAITPVLGGYMTKVFNGERTFLSIILRPVEHVIYAICGVNEKEDQHWTVYSVSMLLFSLIGFLLFYAIQRLQGVCRSNPQNLGAMSEHLSFNTAISFITNTNWQSYVPETTMSYLTQMSALTMHNFASAATGIALAIALIRGFARRSAQGLGNFWVDMVRCSLYILLPVSILVGLFFVWQGVPQNLSAYVNAVGLDGVKQTIAMGPVASQEVIKMFGTNGGGFFNANSAHPFEKPQRPDQSDSDHPDLLAGCGAHQRVRAHGRQHEAGLGDLRRHGRSVPGRRRHRLLGGSTWQPRLCGVPCRPDGQRPCKAAAAWKARKCASASRIRLCSPPSRPMRPAARSMPCTTA